MISGGSFTNFGKNGGVVRAYQAAPVNRRGPPLAGRNYTPPGGYPPRGDYTTAPPPVSTGGGGGSLLRLLPLIEGLTNPPPDALIVKVDDDKVALGRLRAVLHNERLNSKSHRSYDVAHDVQC